METKNAIIKSAFIGYEDHGILTAFISLDYGSAGQIFGGWGPGSLAKFVGRTLTVVEANGWNDLTGKTIRVKADFSKVHAIGHIVKDNWFCPSEEFQADEKKEEEKQ